jgi:magnesium-transporting ATPase (P-type)
MNTLITVLKSKQVQWALVVAVLSVIQGFVTEFPLTPVHQMIIGLIISVVVVLLKVIEGV